MKRLQWLLDILQLPITWFQRSAPSVQDRLVGAVLFVPSATVLFIARSLTPDPAGFGTHRQLGLGGCTILTMTGLPCPMCGMTTTFSHLAHFQVLQALGNQPFGLILFALTLGAAVMGGLDLLLPRQRWRHGLDLLDRHEAKVAYGLLTGMGLGWVYKVLLMNGSP